MAVEVSGELMVIKLRLPVTPVVAKAVVAALKVSVLPAMAVM